MKKRISDIKNFVEAATCRTITEAAEKLEISQPALSESIKRLEHDIGGSLFYRSRSGISLTPEGRFLLLKGKEIFSCLDEFNIDDKAEKSFFGNRKIKVGCHQTVGQYTLPKAFNLLSQVYGDFNVEIVHGLSREVQIEIQRGIIDIGVVVNPTKAPDLVIKYLAADEVKVWAPSTSFKTNTVFCNLDLFQTQSILRRWRQKPEKVVHTDSLELISRFVANRVGYGIVPGRVVEISAPVLVPLKKSPMFKDKIAMVYRPEFGKNPIERAVIESIINALT
jgi:DNA-binding transcriptional LysR family regulator